MRNDDSFGYNDSAKILRVDCSNCLDVGAKPLEHNVDDTELTIENLEHCSKLTSFCSEIFSQTDSFILLSLQIINRCMSEISCLHEIEIY